MERNSWPLTDEHLKALGRVVYQFQSLEQELHIQIRWLAAPLDQRKQMVMISHYSFGNLLSVFEELFKIEFEGFPDVLPDLKSTLKKISKVEESRNQLLHSFWGQASYTGGGVARYKVKRKPSGPDDQFHFEPLTAEAIDVIADGFLADHVELVELGIRANRLKRPELFGLVPDENPQ